MSMLLSMKGQYRKQKGFSLLEALLAIVIIVAAGLGVVELFMSADKKNKLSTTEQIVNQVASAASQYLSTNYDTSDQVSAANLIASGMAPQNATVNGTTFGSPYGAVTVQPIKESGARDQYYVTVESISGEQAMRMCQDMFSSTAVYAGTTAPSGAPVSTFSACGTTFAPDYRGGMAFGYPKDAYVTDAAI